MAILQINACMKVRGLPEGELPRYTFTEKSDSRSTWYTFTGELIHAQDVFVLDKETNSYVDVGPKYAAAGIRTTLRLREEDAQDLKAMLDQWHSEPGNGNYVRSSIVLEMAQVPPPVKTQHQVTNEDTWLLILEMGSFEIREIRSFVPRVTVDQLEESLEQAKEASNRELVTRQERLAQEKAQSSSTVAKASKAKAKKS